MKSFWKQCLSLVAVLMIATMSSVAWGQSLQPIENTTPVGEVQAVEYTVLPTIDWGGEYALLYANGNAKRTTPDSLFGRAGLKIELWRENNPQKQLEAYLSGRTPYFRGTLGMLNQVLPVMDRDLRTKPVVFVLTTRSTGGDTLAVGPGIKTVGDLKNKRVAMQAQGPHLEFAYEILKMAGLKITDVKWVWTKELSGPADALRKGQADAAFCIMPDALALTQGSGAESSVPGTRIMLTTKTYQNVIFDVVAVRSDYFASHRNVVNALTAAILKAEDELVDTVFKEKNKPIYRTTVTAFSKIILGGEFDFKTAEEMILDFTFARFTGNEKFFSGKEFPTFGAVTASTQSALKQFGLMKSTIALAHANWDYPVLRASTGLKVQAEAPMFDTQAVAAVVKKQQAQGRLDDGQIFPTFQINFKPNQKDFSVNLYSQEYERVVGDLQKLGGAVIVIIGHIDPMKYLRRKQEGASHVELQKIKQEGRNLSLQRANQVMSSIIDFASTKGVRLDVSQFMIDGHGFDRPLSGMCGADPCAPASEQAWLDNMRVEFRIIQLEAEEQVWRPL